MVKKTFRRSASKETVQALKLDYQPVYDDMFADLIAKLDKIELPKTPKKK